MSWLKKNWLVIVVTGLVVYGVTRISSAPLEEVKKIKTSSPLEALKEFSRVVINPLPDLEEPAIEGPSIMPIKEDCKQKPPRIVYKKGKVVYKKARVVYKTIYKERRLDAGCHVNWISGVVTAVAHRDTYLECDVMWGHRKLNQRLIQVPQGAELPVYRARTLAP